MDKIEQLKDITQEDPNLKMIKSIQAVDNMYITSKYIKTRQLIPKYTSSQEKSIIKSFISDKSLCGLFKNYEEEVMRSKNKVQKDQDLNYSSTWHRDFQKRKIDEKYVILLEKDEFQQQRLLAKNENLSKTQYQYKRPQYLKMLQLDFKLYCDCANKIKNQIVLSGVGASGWSIVNSPSSIDFFEEKQVVLASYSRQCNTLIDQLIEQKKGEMEEKIKELNLYEFKQMRKQNKQYFSNKEIVFLKKLEYKRQTKWNLVKKALMYNLQLRRKMLISLKEENEENLYFPKTLYRLKGTKKLFAYVRVGEEYKIRRAVVSKPHYVFQIDLVTIFKNLSILIKKLNV